MRSLAVAAGIVVTIVFLGANEAVAKAPIREPDTPLDATFAAGEVCSFPVHLESIEDQGTITTFPDGHILVTGRFVVRVTDLLTGKSIDVNASGPFELRFQADGTTSFDTHGPFLWILSTQDVGGPGLVYTSGHVTAIADQDFFLVTFHVTGTSLDICPAVG